MYLNRVTIQSQCARREIIERLKLQTYTGKLPFSKFNFTDKLFYGKIGESDFGIARVKRNKNSILPYMSGKIMDGATTTILVKMRPRVSSVLLLVVINAVVLWQVSVVKVTALILYLVFINLLFVVNYIRECRKVRELFKSDFAKGCC